MLAASLLKREGPNRDVLRIVFGLPESFQVYYSSQIIAEYEDVLSRPFITGRGLAREASIVLEVIRGAGIEVIPKIVPAVVYPDPDDRSFLEAAVYVGGILITNNLKDYPFLGVNIVGPEEFVAWWGSRGAQPPAR